MEVLYPRCAGLDVHKDQVTACIRVAEASAPNLEQIESLDRSVREVEARVGEALAPLSPFREQVEALKTIPGVCDVVAHVIAAEVRLDMNRFPRPQTSPTATSASTISTAATKLKIANRLIKRLDDLGLSVEIRAVA
jgi:hypothetical protein